MTGFYLIWGTQLGLRCGARHREARFVRRGDLLRLAATLMEIAASLRSSQ